MARKKNDNNVIEIDYKPQHLPRVSHLSWWMTPDPNVEEFKKVRAELVNEIAADLKERNLDQYSSLEEPIARIRTRFEMTLAEQMDQFLKYCSLSATRILAENKTRQKRLREDIDVLDELSATLHQHIHSDEQRRGEKK